MRGPQTAVLLACVLAGACGDGIGPETSWDGVWRVQFEVASGDTVCATGDGLLMNVRSTVGTAPAALHVLQMTCTRAGQVIYQGAPFLPVRDSMVDAKGVHIVLADGDETLTLEGTYSGTRLRGPATLVLPPVRFGVPVGTYTGAYDARRDQLAEQVLAGVQGSWRAVSWVVDASGEDRITTLGLGYELAFDGRRVAGRIYDNGQLTSASSAAGWFEGDTVWLGQRPGAGIPPRVVLVSADTIQIHMPEPIFRTPAVLRFVRMLPAGG